jgi:cytochrome c-type biogenesis protein CcmH/NrfG
MKTLRIIFTVLSALCVAAVIPVGVAWGWPIGLGFVLGALLFFGLMLLCKQKQVEQEEKSAAAQASDKQEPENEKTPMQKN